MLFPCHKDAKPYSHYADRYLSPFEKEWVKLQPFLLKRGYKLRRRYQPNWKPSWSGRTISLNTKYVKEDYLELMFVDVIDAIRTCDKTKVVLKRVETSSAEISVLRLLNSPELRADRKNNIVAVFDILLAPDTDRFAYVVMPRLIVFAIIPFQFTSEVFEAFRQFLDGLTFLHDHNIAHMDACLHNLMMDHSKVVPGGVHFSDMEKSDKNFNRQIRYKSRREVGPTKYYFIDVGYSRVHQAEARGRVGYYGRWGQDRTIPEFSQKGVKHDPFRTDVCQLGKVFGRIVENYEGLSVLQPLVEAMTVENPYDRITAADAASMLSSIASTLTPGDNAQRIYYKACSQEYRRRLKWGLSPVELLDMHKYLCI